MMEIITFLFLDLERWFSAEAIRLLPASRLSLPTWISQLLLRNRASRIDVDVDIDVDVQIDIHMRMFI